MRLLRSSLVLILGLCLTAAAVDLNPVHLFPVVVRFIFRIKRPADDTGNLQKHDTPGQSFGVKDSNVHLAKERCANWTWAAAVETLLATSGVEMTQGDWVTRVEGGELCKDQSPTFEQMSKALNGSYYRNDGTKVTLEARNVTGAPTVIDDILVAMRDSHPLVLFWKGRAYLMNGVTYTESQYANGAKMYVITDIQLLDPLASKPEDQLVTFSREKDDPNDIDGVMDVAVTPEEGQSWLHPETEYQKNHRSPAERAQPPLAPPPPPPKEITP